jgi:hypothetical protein
MDPQVLPYIICLPQKKPQQFMQIFLYCTIYVCDKYVYTSFLYTMNKDFVHVNNKNKANIEFILQFVYRWTSEWVIVV